METRIEKTSLETLGAVEREREREREHLTNSYVNCLLKQASFSDVQKYENGINKFNRDSEKSALFKLGFFMLSFLICCERIKFWQGRFYLKGKGTYVVYVTAF